MKRGTIFIFLFILIAGGIIGASRFLGSQPPLEFTIAVDPLAQSWVQQAVNAFNDTQPVVNTRRIQFSVTPIDDLAVWGGQGGWTPTAHPDAWIAASTTSLNFARSNSLPLVVVADSLARTPLLWGAYVSRLNVLTTNGAQPLDWETVAAGAKAEAWVNLGGSQDWQFIKLGFAQPTAKMGGLGALLTGAAAYFQTADLTAVTLSPQPFRNWMQPVLASVPSYSTLGADPAAAMARGPSTVEIALLPESQWLPNLNGINNREAVQVSYPAYQFMLDFPMSSWQDNQPTNPDRQAAVALLRDWLLTPAQQAAAPAFGLRAAAVEPTDADALFANAVQYGIQLNPVYGELVDPPTLNEVRAFLQWVAAN